MLRIETRRRPGGLTLREAVNVAKKRIKDGRYLISRHGAWFRPNAQGYTRELAEAGVFTADEARSYIDVDGLHVVPVEQIADMVVADIAATERRLASLQALLATFH